MTQTNVLEFVTNYKGSGAFMQSVQQQVNAGKTLSVKQIAVIEKIMAEKQQAPTTQKVLVGKTIPTGTYALMNDNGGHDFFYVKSPTNKSSKWYGWSFIMRKGQDKAAAKINPQGELYGAEDVVRAAAEIVADALYAAKMYGKLTGECCVCGKELTVKESVEAGIGPICAKKFA